MCRWSLKMQPPRFLEQSYCLLSYSLNGFLFSMLSFLLVWLGVVLTSPFWMPCTLYRASLLQDVVGLWVWLTNTEPFSRLLAIGRMHLYCCVSTVKLCVPPTNTIYVHIRLVRFVDIHSSCTARAPPILILRWRTVLMGWSHGCPKTRALPRTCQMMVVWRAQGQYCNPYFSLLPHKMV